MECNHPRDWHLREGCAGHNREGVLKACRCRIFSYQDAYIHPRFEDYYTQRTRLAYATGADLDFIGKVTGVERISSGRKNGKTLAATAAFESAMVWTFDQPFVFVEPDPQGDLEREFAKLMENHIRIMGHFKE